jgi:hypothetical protein
MRVTSHPRESEAHGRGHEGGRRRLRACCALASILLLALPAVGLATGPVPDHISYAVDDVDAVKAQLQAATGNRFSPVTTSVVTATLAGQATPQTITLQRATSVRGRPVIELVEASPRIGPWGAGSDRSSFATAYVVTSLADAGARMRTAGMTPVASGAGFSYSRGIGGVLAKLVDRRLPAGSANQPTAQIDLGPVTSATLGPCDQPGLKDQLSAALGIDWRLPLLLPLPWVMPDGTLRPQVLRADASQNGSPFVTLEGPPDVPPEYVCTATSTPIHMVFFTGDVPAAEQQLAAAGMSHVATVPLAISFYRGRGGIFVQAVHSSFAIVGELPSP